MCYTRPEKWMAGTVIEVQGPRKYLVSSQGRTRKVHADHLLPGKSPDTRQRYYHRRPRDWSRARGRLTEDKDSPQDRELTPRRPSKIPEMEPNITPEQHLPTTAGELPGEPPGLSIERRYPKRDRKPVVKLES